MGHISRTIPVNPVNSSSKRPRRGSAGVPLTAVVILALSAACVGSTPSSTASALPTPLPVMETPSLSPTATAPVASPTPPIDDPATAATEVAGEMLAEALTDAESAGPPGLEAYRGNIWRGTYWVSDPRVAGTSTAVMRTDWSPDGSGRWYLVELRRAGNGTWDGLGVGAIRVSGVHEGRSVALGSGDLAGLELHLKLYIGPGARTTAGDRFEITGLMHGADVDGWTADPTVSIDAAEAIEALFRAWDAGDAEAALTLFADDGSYVGVGDKATKAADIVPGLVEADADSGIQRQLGQLPVVRGNYACAAVKVSDATGSWVELVTLRFDAAGGIVQYEVIWSSSN